MAQVQQECDLYLNTDFDSDCLLDDYLERFPELLELGSDECMLACRGNTVQYTAVCPNGIQYSWNIIGAQNYTLWRTSLLTSETENVTSDRVDCFTMNSQYIFYSTSTDQGALKRCDLDGSNQYILYQGITNSLNLTSRYLYFKAYGSDDLIYHIPLDFSQGASLFMP